MSAHTRRTAETGNITPGFESISQSIRSGTEQINAPIEASIMQS